MNARRTIDCPRCKRPVDYVPEAEGKAGDCPHCDERIWYSKLAHPLESQSLADPPNMPTESSSPSSKPRSSTVTWSIVGLMVIFFTVDNYKLRQELRRLSDEVRSNNRQQTEQATISLPLTTSLNKADINQAQLATIVSELNAIEAVIETKLAQFSSRSSADAERIAQFASTLESMVEEIEQLDLGMTEIQNALNALMDNYEQLESDFSRTQ